MWSGFEIGIAAEYPHESIEQDYEYVPQHPLKDAYYLYNPPPHDRPTWDPTAVLCAVFPDRGYFELSPAGRVVIEENGASVFTAAKDGKGRDRYLALNDLLIARVREAIVQLASEPPHQP